MSQNEFRVVVNDEGQYSIWAKDAAPPAGWQLAGFTGTEQRCLTYIEQVWTDMRPRSLRKRLERDTL